MTHGKKKGGRWAPLIEWDAEWYQIEIFVEVFEGGCAV